MTETDAVAVESLERSYGPVVALSGVSFSAKRGEILGIIGPDGAGKSTLIRILATLILPGTGRASVCGYDVVGEYREIRKLVGYMPGRFSLYQDLTVRENLEFFASVFGARVEDNLRLVEDIYRQIEPFADRRAGALSGGMKQKLALSCALIHRPEVLLLDEPTTGVDPVSRRELWDMLAKLKESGICVLVSTPYMDEAALCDRVALMSEGRFLALDAPCRIASDFRGDLFAVRGSRMARLLPAIRGIDGVASCFAFGDAHHVTVEPGAIDGTGLVRELARLGFSDAVARRIEPCMEDSFMNIAGREVR